MLVTASTIKDSPDNVRFFVTANLASGVDHMVVFLDAPGEPEQKRVRELLDSHPHVTCVPTGPRWWDGDRPGNLNVRQRINANWTRSLLEPFPWAEWLLHVDGDEVACVDRDALASVPPDRDVLRLPPLEAVSEVAPVGRPTRFKRLLDDDDLTLLHVLGVLAEPTNQAYFHGHVMGKSGIRPRSGLGLTLHEAVDSSGSRVPGHEVPGVHVLHYDAPSGEEFVRKWQALAGAGGARYRASRAPTARALRTLIGRDLPEATREKYLRRIYELTTADDVAVLDELGLLVTADPEAGGHVPSALPDADAFAARVEELRAGPKRGYFVADRAKDGKDRKVSRSRLGRLTGRG